MRCHRNTAWESWSWVMWSFHQRSPHSLIQDISLASFVAKLSSAMNMSPNNQQKPTPDYRFFLLSSVSWESKNWLNLCNVLHTKNRSQREGTNLSQGGHKLEVPTKSLIQNITTYSIFLQINIQNLLFSFGLIYSKSTCPEKLLLFMTLPVLLFGYFSSNMLLLSYDSK